MPIIPITPVAYPYVNIASLPEAFYAVVYVPKGSNEGTFNDYCPTQDREFAERIYSNLKKELKDGERAYFVRFVVSNFHT